LVDDDAGFRALLRATFELAHIDVDEAASATAAEGSIRVERPDVIVLDVRMPRTDGLVLCRKLKDDPQTRAIPVVMLTGDEELQTEAAARAAGADAFLRKPFRPLELLGLVEQLAHGIAGLPSAYEELPPSSDQLTLYARDLRRLLEIERGQRVLLERAYGETVSALASALETKDTGTHDHSYRVQQIALELARGVDPDLADNRAIAYGFLLHDVGKIGIPDRVLHKRGPLDPSERRLMQTHTVLGEQMLSGVAFLRGPGLGVVRSHHERWDGRGYPDGLARSEISLGARVFAVADTIDAMTSDRPYRDSLTWDAARAEVLRQAGSQFDPDVVGVFREREDALRDIQDELAAPHARAHAANSN
jgi:response regulator RpfG family c-di-GMP phosphodiesterase